MPPRNQIPFNMGDNIGLWTIKRVPELKDGKTTKDSKYTCVCNSCLKQFEVRHINLATGRSLGCNSCRVKAARKNAPLKRKPNPNNPLCGKCGGLTKIYGTKTKKSGTTKYFKCSDCQFKCSIKDNTSHP